jgi:hypothetical protein
MAIVLDGTNGVTTNSGTLISATTIGVGGATPSASGAGITFPASQSASTNANTLDDYEEGTWTPSLTFGNNSVGMTYATNGQVGNYVKVGKLVYVQMWIQLTNKGSSTGGALITGLPFSALNSSSCYQGASATHWAAINTFSQLGLYFNPNNSVLEITGGVPPTSTTTGANETNFSNNSYIIWSCSYITNS